MRILATAALLGAILTSCASSPRTCATWSISITAEGPHNSLAAPGIPVDVVVRSTEGRVLYSGRTDAEGNLSAEVCATPGDPPMQIEALLRYSGDAYTGTIASVRKDVTRYCVVLPSRVPQHCN
jgi:hypothetical protein